jgi:tetratricopeptide (TPR) repeat protein
MKHNIFIALGIIIVVSLLVGCGHELALLRSPAAPDEIVQGSKLLQSNQTAQASALFDQAIRKDPVKIENYLMISDVASITHHPDIAIRYAEEGIAACPRSPVNLRAALYTTAAISWRDMGDYQKALSEHQAAYNLAPDNPLLMNNLGYAYTELPDCTPYLDKALELTQKAVEMARSEDASDEEVGTFLDSVGWVYFKQNNLDRAQLNLERAASMAGDKSEIHYHLAMVYIRQNRNEDAIVELQRALKIDPSYRDAQDQLSRLQSLPQAPVQNTPDTESDGSGSI